MILSALLLNGCGEFAYKRGASVSDLENSKKACLAKGGDSATIDKCMEDSGWVVQKFNESDPVIETSYNPDNRNITKPADNPAASPSSVTKADTPKNDSVVSTTTSPTVSGANEKAASPSVAQAQAPQKIADPMDSFKISSWWKIGSGPENLKAATEECVGVLGEAHRPDIQGQYVIATRGLLVCMREKGWRALRAK